MMALTFFLCISTFSIYSAQNVAPQIQTQYGPIQGTVSQYRGVNVLEYKGIPYARPPINEDRFLPPSQPDPWQIPIDGSKYGSMCMQQGNSTKVNQSEDCLYMNVFVNEYSYYQDVPLPVIVYIHGGGFLVGSGNLVDELDPNPLTSVYNVVLVSFNFRLGYLGFFYPGSDIVPSIRSNAGFLDQIFALKWVQDNIAQFRGDPSRVTIFGEMAGSMSVGLHLLSPASGKLFNNAIMNGGAIWNGIVQRNATKDASYQIIKDVGCTDHSDILSCLQGTPVEDIMKPVGWIGNPYQPIFGDDVLPTSTSQAIATGSFNRNKNIFVGTEKDDGAIFLAFDDNSLLFGNVTYDQAVDAVHLFTNNQSTDFFIEHYLKHHENGSSDDIKRMLREFANDLIFKCPTYVFASSIANASQIAQPSIYAYVHTQKPKTLSSSICRKIPSLGPCHKDDLPFVFGTPFRQPDLYSRGDQDLSSQMMEIWTTFAKTGTPPNQGPIDWPAFGQNQKGNYIMELNSKNLGVLHHKKVDFCIDNWNYFLQVYDPQAHNDSHSG
ncbi:acetylcholinesterase-like [Brevipalpus obovatus]|uniref:acetylcholinesterase-like n=1 Tax=Brevipalpus obovatus TaxID=246614 RepID=UPI003D9E363C